MTLDDLYLYADAHGITVDWILFKHAESLSAPIGDSCVIAIDPSKVGSSVDEKMKLAHELGHCETASFYSPHDDLYTRQRFENRADNWAIKLLVPAEELERALSDGYTEVWELAERFSVSENFVKKALIFHSKNSKISAKNRG